MAFIRGKREGVQMAQDKLTSDTICTSERSKRERERERESKSKRSMGKRGYNSRALISSFRTSRC